MSHLFPLLSKYSLTSKQIKLFLYFNFEKFECAWLDELLNEKHQEVCMLFLSSLCSMIWITWN